MQNPAIQDRASTSSSQPTVPIPQQELSQKENIQSNAYPKSGVPPQEKIVDIKTFIREEHERQQNNES